MASGQTSEAGGRYGAYEVKRNLVRAPGAWLVEAEDDQGVRCILQLARCKPATDPEAKRDRKEYVEMIDAATQHLAKDRGIELLAHGSAEEKDGSLMLFWALPWPDGADTLGHAQVDHPKQLTDMAVALLAQTAERHERGRLTPTLTEQVLILRPEQRPLQVGLPIHLPPGWLTSDLPSPRLAPEERDRAEPRLSGDIWRVGRTLRALGAHLTDTPTTLKECLDRMDAESLDERYPDAQGALTALETLRTELSAEDDALDGPPLPSSSAVEKSDDGVIDEPPLPRREDRASREDRGDTQISIPRPMHGEVSGLEGLKNAPPIGKDGATVRVSLSEADRESLFGPESEQQTQLPTSRSRDLDQDTVINRPIPKAPSAAQSDDATLQDVSLSALVKEGGSGSMNRADPAKLPKAPPTRRTVWDKADAAVPPPTKPVGPKGTVVGVRLINDPSGLRGQNDPKLPSLLPPPEIVKPGSEPSVDRRTAEPSVRPAPTTPGPSGTVPMAPVSVPGGAGAPMLPGPAITPMAPGQVGHGPMVTPAGQVGLHGHPGYAAPVPPLSGPPAGPGDGSMIPGVSPMGPGIPMPGADPYAPAQRRAPGTGEIPRQKPRTKDVPVTHVQSGSGISVMLGLIIFVAGVTCAIAAQALLFPPEESKPQAAAAVTAQTIHPAGEVLLQASPADAVVVSEADGQILGKTPMRFLVPKDSSYPILITAKDHEPTRLILPERGRLRTDLVPLEDRPPCRIQLKTPQAERLSAVAANVKVSETYRIKGAAVLRSSSGRGAWLVRCPSLGGTTVVGLKARLRPSTHRLAILSPPGASIAIDGQAEGKVPYRGEIRGRFVLVRAETVRSGASERWIPLFAPTRLKMPTPRGQADAASSNP